MNTQISSEYFPEKLRVAIVHDFLLYRGGAEKTLEAIAEMFPSAPIYTILYDREGMRDMFSKRDIHPSFLQKLPNFLRCRYRWLVPFFGVAVETFDLRDFDLVITSSGAWSKGIVTKLKTAHVAYIHSPMRYVWDYNERYWKETRRKPSLLKRLFFSYMRMWDRMAADRPDIMLANSVFTQQRIDKYYRRSSTLVYPPVDAYSELNTQSYKRDCFLTVSRLNAPKRLNLIVDAFNKLHLPLVIIGDGPERKLLESSAGKYVRIMGWQSDEVIARFLNHSRAFVFPSEDDFGIAPAEALRSGVPVIAYRGGSAEEFIQEGVNGELFDTQSVESVANAVRIFLEREETYDRRYIRADAERFSKECFQRKFSECIRNFLYNERTGVLK